VVVLQSRSAEVRRMDERPHVCTSSRNKRATNPIPAGTLIPFLGETVAMAQEYGHGNVAIVRRVSRG
jgi:hypothetical protein